MGLRVVIDADSYYDNSMTTVGEKITCQRCQHEWYARIPRPPVQCPRCKSPAWDRPNQVAETRVRYKPESREISIRRGSQNFDFKKEPAFGMWADRTESDEQLLEQLRSGWGPPPGDESLPDR